jgi:hypothetical protein
LNPFPRKNWSIHINTQNVFSGNSKVIDRLPIAKFKKARRHSKIHSIGDYACYKFKRVPSSFQTKPTKDALYCTSEWGKRKLFASFRSVKSVFL